MLATSARLNAAPRTEQQALRAIYDRRATAIRRHARALRYAADLRALADHLRRDLQTNWMETARSAIRQARGYRYSSTMGARLP